MQCQDIDWTGVRLGGPHVMSLRAPTSIERSSFLKSTKLRDNPATTQETWREVWDYQLGRPSLFGSCRHMLICPDTMSAYPRFFSQPFRYLRWAAIEKPAIFYSIVIGSLGPVTIFVVPPIRTLLGDPKRPEIPLTYPSTIPRFKGGASRAGC